jgi:prepilin-type N-terminal cleavage/methylation domain-containing protein
MNNSSRSKALQPVAGNRAGFTLLEIMVGVAIVAILGLIGVLGYQKYIEKARGADLMVKYDALRSTFNADTGQSSSTDCAELANRAGTARLADAHVKLDYGFEAVAGGGYRPVLTVCATADKNGKQGIAVARGAHDTLSKTATVEKGAVVSDSVVSFALPLTDGNRALCKIAPVTAATACGGSAPAQNAGASGPTVPAGVDGCPPGKEPYYDRSQGPGVVVRSCVDICGPGQVRDPRNYRWCAPAPTATAVSGGACPDGQTRNPLDPAKCIPAAGNAKPAGAGPAPPVRAPVVLKTSGGWVASLDYRSTLPAVAPNDPKAGRWYSVGGDEGTMTSGPTTGMPVTRNTWVVNIGNPDCGTNGYITVPRGSLSATPIPVTVQCKDGGSLIIELSY